MIALPLSRNLPYLTVLYLSDKMLLFRKGNIRRIEEKLTSSSADETALAAIWLSVCRRTSWGIPFGWSEEREGILKEEGEREKGMGEGAGGEPGGKARERERENTHLVGRIRKSGRTKSVVSHISCLLALSLSLSLPSPISHLPSPSTNLSSPSTQHPAPISHLPSPPILDETRLD